MNKKLIIGFGLLVILFLWTGISIYPDWLWFGSLNLSPVFLTMLLSKFGFGLLVWLLLILIIFLNLYAAKRSNPEKRPRIVTKNGGGNISLAGLSGKALDSLFIAFILILSFIIASKSSYQWDMVLRYLYQQPFGSVDPIFNRDIGFYLFSLPLYMYIRHGLLVIFIFAGLVSICWYLKEGILQIEGEFDQTEGIPTSLPKITIPVKAKKHLIFLAGIIILLTAWGYQLKIYGLLYSTQGPAFGASYTDVHVKVLAYRALIIL